jgi:hypothetical protein
VQVEGEPQVTQILRLARSARVLAEPPPPPISSPTPPSPRRPAGVRDAAKQPALPAHTHRLGVSLAKLAAVRIPHLHAALALACALFTASCAESLESPSDPAPAEAQSVNDAEPTGEAQEPFGSKAFRFVVEVNDDGEGKAGGWQRAAAKLHFVVHRGVIPTDYWKCPVVVGMPLRSEKEGRISPSRAALLSAEVATEVAASMRLSRDWQGQGAVFCIELRTSMQQMFRDRHPGIGATVTML